MHIKHPGSGWGAQSRYLLPSPAGRGVRPRLGDDRQVLSSLKMRLLLLATLGKAEVWKLSYPALGTGGGSPTACGVLNRGFLVAKQESTGIPLPASSLPISDPSGPATCSSFLRPGIAACKGEPSRRSPHPCLNPDASFLTPFSTCFLQGLWHACPPSLPPRT